jgi:uncharacterized membrane protein
VLVLKTIETKEAFLTELRRQLRWMPEAEQQNVLVYYNEHINDAGPANVRQTLAQLGPPRDIAAQLRQDQLFKEVDTAPPSAKRGFSALGAVFLGLFAAPIALPLALGAACVAIALAVALFTVALTLLVTVFCVILSFSAAAVAMVLGGVVYIGAAVVIAFQHLPTAFLLFGLGLALLGLGTLLGVASAYTLRYCGRAAAELFGRRLPRLFVRLFSKRRRRVPA